MVIVELDGGIGNQLFQYAFGVNLANKLNTELKFCLHPSFTSKNWTYEVSYALSYFNLNVEIVDRNQITINNDGQTASFFDKTLRILSETDHIKFMSDVFKHSEKNLFVKGFWQSEKYFEDSAAEVRKNLLFKEELGLTSAFWKTKIQSERCAVALHIRRSSYNRPLFRWYSGILSAQYYRECVEELKKYVNDFKIFVFSHELNWARKNLKLDVPVEYVEGCERDVDELYLMSLCKHNIVANSTFSWWGAWLNQNLDKKVLAPQLWHLDNWGGDFLVPQSWIKVPSNFTEFAPLLSVIIYVENNVSTIEYVLQSVLNQNFPDREVIVVTKFEDASRAICHKYANYLNFTILNISKDSDKAAACNKGLDCANGEYVIFLTGRDVILPNTVRMVGQSWDFGSQKYWTRDNYMTDENYDKISYDIICSSGYFEENPQGTVELRKNEENSVKMIYKVSDYLENITEPFADCNFKDETKIKFAFSQSLESVVATKIFKKKFLKEKGLRFKENSDMHEALFLIDSILLADQIVFTTTSFLCRLK